jgi:hypothetical protein
MGFSFEPQSNPSALRNRWQFKIPPWGCTQGNRISE